MEIIRVEKTQLRRAAEVVAASFHNYPMFTFYFPDPIKRARYLPWYLRNALTCAYRYGEVHTTTGFEGVMFTLPPGHTKISIWEYIQNGFFATPLVLGFRHYLRSMDCETFVEKVHERIMRDRPHHYLWGLAVHPDHKRKGIGTALLKPLLEKADSTKLPIYLETHDENNIDYYKRAGFSLIHYQFIPNHALPIWCMVREPA